MKVFVFAAHPDDEVLGCGATIAKLSFQGADVRLLTFTDGGSSRDNCLDRRNSVKKSCEILGISMFECLDYPDNMMDTVSLLSVVKSVESFINKNGIPDIVLTHSQWCLNVDHKVVSSAVEVAFRNINAKIMLFQVNSSSEHSYIQMFKKNCYVNVTEFYKKKVDALLLAYYDEVRQHPNLRSIENIQANMLIDGALIGTQAAESFMIVKDVL